MLGAAGLTVMLRVAVPVPPAAPVAVMVYEVAAETAVGVPDITPVALILSPAGKAGLMVAPVSGPPLVIVGERAVIAVFCVYVCGEA